MWQSQCRCADSRRFKVGRMLGWVRCFVPGVLLVFVPKCPLCIMAYAAMFTGLGMSFTTAAYVRVGMIVVCVGAVVYLVGRHVYAGGRLRQTKRVFKRKNFMICRDSC